MFASIGLKIALGLGLIGMAAGGWFYVQNLRAELDLASERQARTMDVVNSQKVALDQLQKDIQKVQEITNDLNVKMRKAEASVTGLKTKFEENSAGKKRDIGKDAERKPEIIQKIINRASKDAIRCGELLTGAPLRPNETNSQCPELTTTKFVKPKQPVPVPKPKDNSIRNSVK